MLSIVESGSGKGQGGLFTVLLAFTVIRVSGGGISGQLTAISGSGVLEPNFDHLERMSNLFTQFQQFFPSRLGIDGIISL